MTCHSRFEAHDGLDVRVYRDLTWRFFALCHGCRHAAREMGFELLAA